jgi:DNA repair protein RadC
MTEEKAVEPREDATAAIAIDAVGHRKRLLDRFSGSGLASLHLHEIVELLLTFSIPRRDTKPLAKDLVRRYRSLSALLNAPAHELAEVNGIGPHCITHLALVREIMAYCLKERYQRKSLITHRRDVEEYLRTVFGHRRDEYVAALFLGNRNDVLETEILAEGTVNQCAVFPRRIMERALHYGATSIIVAHNHPGGGIKPSEADWSLTERLFAICRLLEIPLLDHLIISHQEVVSLKELPRWKVSVAR